MLSHAPFAWTHLPQCGGGQSINRSVAQVQLQYRRGAAHLVAHQQQWFAVGGLGGGHKRQTFRSPVADGCGGGGRVARPVVAGVQVVHTHGFGGGGDVVFYFHFDKTSIIQGQLVIDRTTSGVFSMANNPIAKSSSSASRQEKTLL